MPTRPCHDLRAGHAARVQRIRAVFFRQGGPRKDGKRAAIRGARKVIRLACRILAGPGGGALTAA